MPHGTRLLAVALAFAVLPAAAAVAPPPESEQVRPGRRAGYATDGAGGCWVWVAGMNSSAEAVTASWSGECPNGPAEGPGRSDIRWRDAGRDRGMVYEGTLRGGKAEGRGRLSHRDGNRVIVLEEGEYRDDNLVRGRVEFAERNAVYEGAWQRNGPHGEGRLTIGNQVFEGNWVNGCLEVGKGWVALGRSADECEGRPT